MALFFTIKNNTIYWLSLIGNLHHQAFANSTFYSLFICIFDSPKAKGVTKGQFLSYNKLESTHFAGTS